jgi:predicted enzyme related to lactoylglutathione lyase
MAQPVIHFEIGCADRERSSKFYKELFDWSIQSHEGMDYDLVSPMGEGSIGGGIGPSPDSKPYVTFFVQVENMEPFLKKVEQLGGRVVLPETPIPGVGSRAMVADIDGNVIGLFKEESSR